MTQKLCIGQIGIAHPHSTKVVEPASQQVLHRLDAELVTALWALTEPRRERMLSSPAFGAGKVPEPPALADLQTRLLAILGREA